MDGDTMAESPAVASVVLVGVLAEVLAASIPPFEWVSFRRLLPIPDCSRGEHPVR